MLRLFQAASAKAVMGRVSAQPRYGQDLLGHFVTNAAQYTKAVALIRTPQGGLPCIVNVMSSTCWSRLPAYISLLSFFTSYAQLRTAIWLSCRRMSATLKDDVRACTCPKLASTLLVRNTDPALTGHAPRAKNWVYPINWFNFDSSFGGYGQAFSGNAQVRSSVRVAAAADCPCAMNRPDWVAVICHHATWHCTCPS